jgi:hypothetical protein
MGPTIEEFGWGDRVTVTASGPPSSASISRVRSANPIGPVFNEGVRATEFADPALLRKLGARGFVVDQNNEIGDFSPNPTAFSSFPRGPCERV